MLCTVIRKYYPSVKGDLVEVTRMEHVPQGMPSILKTDTVELEPLKKLATYNPTYLDIDHSVDVSVLKALSAAFPNQKILLSYHNHTETPEDLQALYEQLKEKPAHLYKIATLANNSVDTVRMLEFIYTSDKKVIGIPMGLFGSPGRVLGPIVGNPIDYAPLTEEDRSAPGQLLLDTLLTKFHYKKLSEKTPILGLIGDPIDQSVGETVHNALLEAMDMDGVYVAFKVGKEEVYPFLKYAMRLPFRGLSVTMPLKEMFGAEPVNTLIFKPGRLVVENTDGEAILKVLENVLKKHVVIIGAGGAARAIVQTLERAGADITVLNRTVEKAKKIHPSGRSLDQVPHEYDILINCTPDPLPINPEQLLHHRIVMDIKTTDPLPLLEEAKKRGCHTYSGLAMYKEQALGQLHFWFPNHVSPKKLRSTLSHILSTNTK